MFSIEKYGRLFADIRKDNFDQNMAASLWQMRIAIEIECFLEFHSCEMVDVECGLARDTSASAVMSVETSKTVSIFSET